MPKVERDWVRVPVISSNIFKKNSDSVSVSCVAKWLRGWTANLEVESSNPGNAGC